MLIQFALKRNLINLLFIFIKILTNNKLANAANTCTTLKVEYPVNPLSQWPNLNPAIIVYTSRIILSFKCTQGDSPNPVIPINYGSNQREYNELVLSPNLYNYFPINEVCPFVNIYLLDLSYNQIKGVASVFQSISSCLSLLQILDLSYNSISTPLLASDFNDAFGLNIGSLNLKNNQIPSIDTGVFFKQDGTSRFPRLYNLNLANNQIKVFDLIWPLSLSKPLVQVSIANNPINAINNQLGKTFTDSTFVNLTGSQTVDITNSQLTSLSDSVFFQYVHSASQFQYFLYKISNYNFQQTVNQLSCVCPTATGLYTVYWYQSFKNSIVSKSAPIFQLNCSNQAYYIFDFPCQFFGTTTSLTTTVTSTSTSTSTLTSFVTASDSALTTTTAKNNNGSAEAQLGDTTPKPSTSASENSHLWLLFLLIIPILLILFFCFVCLCGRLCLSSCFKCTSIHCCSCMRPDKNTKEVLDKKKLDCVVIHGESDDLWVNKNLKPMFANYKSKAIKLQNVNQILGDDQVELIRQSRRVVIVFTRKFLENEWKNKQLHDLLKNIYFSDENCVIVALIVGDINEQEVNNLMIDIDPTLENQTKLEKFRRSLEKRIRHNTGLEHVEIIKWHETGFFDDFKFVMPPAKKVSIPTYKQIPAVKEQPLPTRTESPADSYVAERRYSISSNDLPLITSLSKSIEETMRSNRLALGSQKVFPVNDQLPPQSKRLTKGMLSNQNFWISMPTAQTEVYEPVSTAGPANEGNKEAYLKRFGVSHGYVGYISEEPPADNPLPQPKFEASTNYRTNKSVRLTRLDLAGIDNGQSDDQSDIYDPNIHNHPIGWTTTDSGRRIIVPESMLTKLGGAESRLASISETNEILSNKKNKKRIDKKLKIQSQNYLVSENNSRPSSVEDSFKDTKAIIRSKSSSEKKEKKNNSDNQLNEKANIEKNNLYDENHNQIQKNIINNKRRNSLSRLQEIEEMSEEKRIQSIIKDNTNGDSVKASLSGIKVTKKVTYASSADKKIHEIDAIVNELDENIFDEKSEKKKKKKKKKSKSDELDNEI